MSFHWIANTDALSTSDFTVMNLIQTQGTVHMNVFKKHLGRIEKVLKSLSITIEKDLDSQTNLSQKEEFISNKNR